MTRASLGGSSARWGSASPTSIGTQIVGATTWVTITPPSLSISTRIPMRLARNTGFVELRSIRSASMTSGHVSTVSVEDRYGVEGAIFQKPDFDWDYYYKVMCKSVPASHAPSYFPASDSQTAQDAAMFLIPAIDLAHSSGTLPYRLACHGYKQPCSGDIRKFIGDLRLEGIDKFDLSNCPLPAGPKEVCFTVETGEGRLGPFPKTITVKGSTFMNNPRV